MKRTYIVFVALVVLALLIGSDRAALADPPVYDVEFLGVVTGAAAMNESGEMVGTTVEAGANRGWVAGPGRTLTLLPLPAGMVGSWANDLNDLGEIVGFVTNALHRSQAAKWTPDGNGGYTMQMLGMLPGHIQSGATAINNLGDIVGASSTSMYSYAVFFTAPGGILDLSPWGIFQPTDINDQRVLVDNSFTVKRLDLDTMVAEDLGVPSGGGWLATRSIEINEQGQVAGTTILSCCPDCDYHAARYTDGPGWEVLSSCGHDNMGTGINDLGDVVMRLNVYPYARLEGIGTYRIEDLISDDHGHWYVVNGYGNKINNSRMIATFATNEDTGQSGLVLLHPRTTTDAGGPFVAATLPEILGTSPNPSRTFTEIRYALPTSAGPVKMSLQIHDAAGRVVRSLVNGMVEPGSHASIWDGRNEGGQRVPSGVYFVKMNAAGALTSRRVLRLN